MHFNNSIPAGARSTEEIQCFFLFTGLTSKNKPLFLEADIILYITSKNRPFFLEVERGTKQG